VPFKAAAAPVLPAGDAARGESLRVKVVIVGPGDPLYLWWGHCGLIIEDSAYGSSTFYDWGQFSFESGNFYRDFAFGLLVYACGSTDTLWQLRNFQAENRDIRTLTLDLPPETRDAIRLFCEFNNKPENRAYLYHFFKDNCATRVRDIIDAALGGALYEAASGAESLTVRQNIRRYMYFNPFFDWFLNFLMGPGIDTRGNLWEQMFLPMEVGTILSDFVYTDADGSQRALVLSNDLLFSSSGRPPVLDFPPWDHWIELLVSVLVSVLVFFSAWKGLELPRLGLQFLLGLFFGVAGSLLFFMSLFTDHDYTWGNLNLLFVNPLWFALIPLTILHKKKAAQYATGIFWALITLLLLSALIARRFTGQDMEATVLLVLPFTLAFLLSQDLFRSKFASIIKRRDKTK
jgi:hypothetical protein